MATYQEPRVPAFARELDPEIVQLHSVEYRNPAQLRSGGVLIVGAGNSGAEIAIELARTHHTVMSGRDTGQVPFKIDSALGRLLVPIVFRLVFHRILSMGTPIGRRARPKMISQGTPLIRVKSRQLQEAGVERVGRTTGVRDGKPVLEDGRVLDVTNVIWCTGFAPNNSWIDLPVFEDNDEAIHERGVVASQPGLYFVGLHFLYALSSTMIHGIARDAEYITDAIAKRAGDATEIDESSRPRVMRA
jgi:putative flavoprotein involved in K+ transport